MDSTQPIPSAEITSEFRLFICNQIHERTVSDVVFKWNEEHARLGLSMIVNHRPVRVPIPEPFARYGWSIVESIFPNLAKRVLTTAAIEDSCTLVSPHQRRPLRFRVSLSLDLEGHQLVMRRLSTTIPTVQELLLPERQLVDEFCLKLKEGFVLIVGGTSHGKTTTMASLIQERARRIPQRVITIEDPIEYTYPEDTDSDFVHHQVGIHTESFATGLKEAMRQTPNVICVGEIRDGEAAAIAISAGMSGHVVVATMHASSAAQGIERLYSLLNKSESGFGGPAGLANIASSLKMVVAQQLHYSSRKDRLFPVHEIMHVNAGIRGKIKNGKFGELNQDIESGRQDNMMEFKESAKIRAAEGLYVAA